MESEQKPQIPVPPETPQDMEGSNHPSKQPKGKNWHIVILVTLVLLLSCSTLLFAYAYYNKKPQTESKTETYNQPEQGNVSVQTESFAQPEVTRDTPQSINTQVQTIPPAQTDLEAQLETILNPAYDISLDTETWVSFKSPLGFIFNYPSEWGEVRETIKDIAGTNEGYSGKTYWLEFTNIPLLEHNRDNTVYGSGRSLDFSAGRGGTADDYGVEQKPEGVTASIWARPENCIIPVSSYLYFGRIDFSLPGKDINGVRLQMPIVSSDEVEVLSAEYDSMSETMQAEHCSNVERDAYDYIVELEERNLDELSNKQLFVFKEILSSSQIL